MGGTGERKRLGAEGEAASAPVLGCVCERVRERCSEPESISVFAVFTQRGQLERRRVHQPKNKEEKLLFAFSHSLSAGVQHLPL